MIFFHFLKPADTYSIGARGVKSFDVSAKHRKLPRQLRIITVLGKRVVECEVFVVAQLDSPEETPVVVESVISFFPGITSAFQPMSLRFSRFTTSFAEKFVNRSS